MRWPFQWIGFGDKRELMPKKSNKPKIGDVVVSFDCRGCMATDHVFEWIGRVESIGEMKPPNERYGMVIVEILKVEHRDCRAHCLGKAEVPIIGDLQEISRGVWVWFR